MNTAQKKLNWIDDMIADGRTVYVSTQTRTTKITPKTAKRWADNGNVLFKVSGESLYMAVGKRFDCADYCKLSAS